MALWPNAARTTRECRRLLADALRFLWEERLYWMAPILLILLALGAFFFFTSGGPANPVVYTFF